MMGMVFSYIVGIGHYDAQAGKDEHVVLDRDVENKFDSNAIAVKKFTGDTIGYLPRHVASILAPLIDRKCIEVNGFVYGEPGRLEIPLAMEIYQDEDGANILRKMNETSKDAKIHNALADLFVNAEKYTSEEIMKLRNYYNGLANLPESKLIHKLLEYKQLTLEVRSKTKVSSDSGSSLPVLAP